LGLAVEGGALRNLTSPATSTRVERTKEKESRARVERTRIGTKTKIHGVTTKTHGRTSQAAKGRMARIHGAREARGVAEVATIPGARRKLSPAGAAMLRKIPAHRHGRRHLLGAGVPL